MTPADAEVYVMAVIYAADAKGLAGSHAGTAVLPTPLDLPSSITFTLDK